MNKAPGLAEEPPLWNRRHEAALRTRGRAVQVEAPEQIATLLDSIRIEQT
jgi:hypothetical protein